MMRLLIAKELSTVNVNVHVIGDDTQYEVDKYSVLMNSSDEELINLCYEILVKDYDLLKIMNSYCTINNEGTRGRYLLYLPKENNLGAETLIVDSIVGEFKDPRYTEFCSSVNRVNIMKCYGLLSMSSPQLLKRVELFKTALDTSSLETARRLSSLIDAETAVAKQAFNILATEYPRNGEREVIIVQDYIEVGSNGIIHNVTADIPGYRRLDYRDTLIDAIELREELANNKEKLESYFYI